MGVSMGNYSRKIESRKRVEREPNLTKPNLTTTTTLAVSDEKKSLSAGGNGHIFIELITNKNENCQISEILVKELEGLYPAVDVKQALREMRGWLIANPKNRKTSAGMMRFVNGWLGREQNKAGRKGGGN